MKQERIALIALLASIIGIALLFATSETIEPKELKILEIKAEDQGLYVKVKARIESFSQRQGIAFMQLYDGTGKIKAISFEAEKFPQLEKGMIAILEGKIQIYKGELELVVEKVSEWK